MWKLFSTPLEELVLKTVQWNVYLFLLLLLLLLLLLWLLYYCCCYRWWYLLCIWGRTCPPIIYFKFITLAATAYYYTVWWSVITNCYIFLSKKCDNLIKKVRQVLQSSTIITKCYRTHRAKSKKRKQQLDDNRFTIMTPDSVFNALRGKFLPWWTIPESLKNNCWT